MKVRLISGMVAMLLMVSVAMAQEVRGPSAGAKAISFSFDGFSLGGFNGGIGGKYFLADAIALRASVGMVSANQEAIANPGTGEVGADGYQKASQMSASVGGEYHFLTSRVSPYAGAQVVFSSTSTESKNADEAATATAIDQTTVKNNVNGELGYLAGTGLGFSALLGAEFFITDGLSLSGEYNLGYMGLSRPDQERIRTQNNVETKTTTKVGSYSVIGTGTAALTVSVYF